jgi:glucose dehydrogenase
MDERHTLPEPDGLSRRTLIVGASAATVAGAFALRGASAQDATPSAEEGGQVTVATPEAELPTIPPEMEEFAGDWPITQGNYAATRVAASTTIDSSNVDQLGVAWSLPIDAASGFGGITSNPIILGDTIYIIDNLGNVQALERETGAVKWRNDYGVVTLGPNGVAIGYGYLVSVLGDTAEVLCLDAETGEEIWRFQLANHNALGITMSPLIYDGYVIVSTEPGGNTKGTYEGGATGVVYCLDIKTGITLWTWDTTTDGLWGNTAVNSGGGLWYPPSVDLDTGLLYMGIGNAGPFPGTEEYPNGTSRPGPNDYANCLVAYDPTGAGVVWYINVKPHDIYDHDNQQTPVLGDVEINGANTRLVFSAGKHGFVVAAGRDTGIEYWRVPVGEHMNDLLDEFPTDGSSVTTLPGVFGGVESPLAYKDGVVYAIAWNVPTTWHASGFDYQNMGLDKATSNVVAIDAATGQIIWDTPVPTGIAGAAPTIANDLLFTGGLDGIVRVYNIADGTLAWSWQAPAGINAPYAIAGDLVLIPAGTFVMPSSDTVNPPETPAPALIALKVGAASEATPTA